MYKRASNIKSKATRKKEQTAKRVAKRKREGRTYQFVVTDAENFFVCAYVGREQPPFFRVLFWSITKLLRHRSGRYVKLFQVAAIGVRGPSSEARVKR